MDFRWLLSLITWLALAGLLGGTLTGLAAGAPTSRVARAVQTDPDTDHLEPIKRARRKLQMSGESAGSDTHRSQEMHVRRRTLALLAAPALIASLACGAGSGDNDTNGPGAAQPASGGAIAPAKGHTIILDVTGPKSADITYGLNADQSQDNGAALPWHKEIPAADLPFATTLLAQSKGTGEIVCTITIDGKIAKTNKSTGQYAVVTCSA